MASPDLPIYKCKISDELSSDLQVDFVSFVDKPAIEKTFQAFKEKIRFTVDSEKRIVSGPAMIADMLIYRNDPGGLGEYYTTFDKETILAIVQKFFKKGFIQNFNVMHAADSKTSEVTVYESYLTDAARGIAAPNGFEDITDGSWFITAKVEDDAIWAKVKSGEVKGFSVEGVFEQMPLKMSKMTPEQAMEKIKAILASIAD